jgi:hypothetical protein
MTMLDEGTPHTLEFIARSIGVGILACDSQVRIGNVKNKFLIDKRTNDVRRML